jgi:hypothetical protein
MLEGSKNAQAMRGNLSKDRLILSSQTAFSALRDRGVSVDRRLVMSAQHKDGEADKLAASVPPWVGDPQEQNEVRRIQERIAALAKQHETSRTSSQWHPSPLQQAADIEPDLASARLGEPKAELEEAARGAWMRTLEPVMMPPPPQQEKIPLPSYGTVAGSIAAICVAAGIALALTNSLRAPTVSAAVSGGSDAGQSQSFPKALLANLTQIPAAEARVQPSAEQSSPSALSVFSALQNNDTAPTQPPAATLPPAQPAIVIPPPAAIPEPRATPTLLRDESVAMLRRGQELIASGDIASARLMLQRVAEAGNAEACFTLAGTFDPAVLARLGVIGGRPNPAKAHFWYARAAELGSSEASQRLQQSALR